MFTDLPTVSGLQSNSSQAAIEILLTSPSVLDMLRKAYLGNYSVILSLLGCLDRGLDAKKLVDRVIDSCKFATIAAQLLETDSLLLFGLTRRPRS